MPVTTTPISSIKDEIERSTELAGNVPKQIKVTVVAIPGSIMDAPMLDRNGRARPRTERQILIHPDDWALVRAEMKATVEAAGMDGAEFDENGRVLMIWGVRVVEGEL